MIQAWWLEKIAIVAPAEEITVRLPRAELALLIEALDSHEYWQLGDLLPRKDGQVFVPGDMDPDLVWGDDEPSAEQRVAIDEIAQCRQLAERLRAAARGRPRPMLRRLMQRWR